VHRRPESRLGSAGHQKFVAFVYNSDFGSGFLIFWGVVHLILIPLWRILDEGNMINRSAGKSAQHRIWHAMMIFNSILIIFTIIE
jgi:hypothetical protein